MAEMMKEVVVVEPHKYEVRDTQIIIPYYLKSKISQSASKTPLLFS